MGRPPIKIEKFFSKPVNGISIDDVKKSCRGSVKGGIYTKGTLPVLYVENGNYKTKEIPVLDDEKVCEEVLTENKGSDNRYYFICSSCGKLRTAKPEYICSNAENFGVISICSACNWNGKDSSRNKPSRTLKDWLENEGKQRKYRLIGQYDEGLDVINTKIRSECFSYKADAKNMVFYCEEHDTYQMISEVRELCDDKRYKERYSNSKSGAEYAKMKCCEDVFTLQDWCLLFYNYVFTAKEKLIFKYEDIDDRTKEREEISEYSDTDKFAIGEIPIERLMELYEDRIRHSINLKENASRELKEQKKKLSQYERSELERQKNADKITIQNARIQKTKDLCDAYKKRIDYYRKVLRDGQTTYRYCPYTGEMVRKYYLNADDNSLESFSSSSLRMLDNTDIQMKCDYDECYLCKLYSLASCYKNERLSTRKVWCRDIYCNHCEDIIFNKNRSTLLTIDNCDEYIQKYELVNGQDIKQIVEHMNTDMNSVRDGERRISYVINDLLKNNKKIQSTICRAIQYSNSNYKLYETHSIVSQRRALYDAMGEKWIEYEKSEQFTADMMLGHTIYMLISPIYSKSQYLYIVSKDMYDMSSENCLYGIPIKIKNSVRRSLIFEFQKHPDEICSFVDSQDIKDIEDVNDIQLSERTMSKLFNAIPSNAFEKKLIQHFVVPGFISQIEEDAFYGCDLEDVYIRPDRTMLLADMGLTTKDCNITSGKVAFADIKRKREESQLGFIQYNDFFKKGEALRIYPDKLTLTRRQDILSDNRNDIPYISNFEYSTYYNSDEEMAICLLLSQRGIMTISNVTAGLVDIYEKLNID